MIVGAAVVQIWSIGGLDVVTGCHQFFIGALCSFVAMIIFLSLIHIFTGVSAKHGHPVTYMQFLKVGFPMMIMSIVLCSIYMLIRYA